MDIIIIGAGSAGLMAARELSARHNITILEAKNKPGGRIHTIKQNIEAGAEFVHGKLPVTLNLLKEAGLSYTAVEGHMYTVENGHWSQEENFVEGWDELLDKMGKQAEDMTLMEFLEIHYAAAEYKDLRGEITRYVQGFDLANPSKVSIKYLHKEWTNEDETNFRIDQGYDALISFMAKDLNIITGSSVKSINWENGKAFWEKDTGFILSKEKVPTWWTQSPNTAPVLTGWLGGPPAENYKQVSEEEILQTALQSLSAIFQRELPALVSSYISNWVQDPAISGSYSYDTPLSENARKVLNTPLQDTIYFAGEALYDGKHPGTVEAALISGKEVAKKI